jgi:putative lipoic acid-binding regulatory protein
VKTNETGSAGDDGWAAADPASLYPAVCHFRIIVTAEFPGAEALQPVLAQSEVTAALQPGKVSGGGKFCSWQVSVRVHDRAEMVRLDRELRAVTGVRMVL